MSVSTILFESRNERNRIESICEKNELNFDQLFDHSKFEDFSIKAHQEIFEKFEIEASLQLWEDGFTEGDASQEELKEMAAKNPTLMSYDDHSGTWDFAGLDAEWCKLYEKKYTAYIEEIEEVVTRISIGDLIEKMKEDTLAPSDELDEALAYYVNHLGGSADDLIIGLVEDDLGYCGDPKLNDHWENQKNCCKVLLDSESSLYIEDDKETIKYYIVISADELGIVKKFNATLIN